MHLKNQYLKPQKPQKASNNQMQPFFTSIDSCHSKNSISRTIESSSQCRQWGDLRKNGDVTTVTQWPWRMGKKKHPEWKFMIYFYWVYIYIHVCTIYSLIWDDSKWVPTGLLMGWFMIGFTHPETKHDWCHNQHPTDRGIHGPNFIDN